MLNDWKDPYNGVDIKPKSDENINDWNKKYVYDHIIPKSYFVFPDNSSSNLIVTSDDNNNKKGDNTPYLYLKNNSRWEKIHVGFTPKVPVFDNKNKKVKLYLDTDKIKKFNWQCEQPHKSEELWELCNSQRLLQDTSYISTYLRKIINNFFKKNSKYKNIETLSIPGKITGVVRGNFLKLKEKRGLEDEFGDIPLSSDFFNNIKKAFYKKRFWYKHHAIDAIIIAMVSTSKRLRMIINNFKKNFSRNETINKIFGFPTIQKVTKYIVTKEAKYSKMLIKKTNIGFFHELPEPKIEKHDENKIKRLKKVKILEISGVYKRSFFEPKKEGKKIFRNLLTEKLDKEALEQLEKIYKEYDDNKKSPFLNFMLDERQKIINNLLDKKMDEWIIKILDINDSKINNKRDLINFIIGDLKKELYKNFSYKNLINTICDNWEYKNIIIEIINKVKGMVLNKKIKKMKLKVEDPIYFYLNNLDNSKKLKIKNIHFIEVIDETKEKYNETHFWHKRTKGYHNSINSIGVDVYYRMNNNKPIAIAPLNVFTIKFDDKKRVISEKVEYYEYLKKQKIVFINDCDRTIGIYNGQKLYRIRIYNGQRLYNHYEKKYYYFSSYSNANNKFEVKPLWYNASQLFEEIKKLKNTQNSKDYKKLEIFEKLAEEWKMKRWNSSPRWFESIDGFFKKYKICHADILGRYITNNDIFVVTNKFS